MADLAEFLLARIAEDEEIGRRAGGRAVSGEDPDSETFILRFGSARVLAECEAKRRIVDIAREYIADAARQPYELWAGGEAMEKALKLLALPYAGHPDYREEWNPAVTVRRP